LSERVFVTAFNSISALGPDHRTVWSSYVGGRALFARKQFGEAQERGNWVSGLDEMAEEQLAQLRRSRSPYQHLDRSVLMAMYAAQRTLADTGKSDRSMGINLGSSRGATALFEQYHRQFLTENKVSAYSSPTTTLGNISAWTAQHLGLKGPTIDHSITCSTGLHAVLNAVAWIRSGMADSFLAGGTEAALTPFTLAQMKALRLYSESENHMACESMRFEKRANTMVLGEGAAVFVLEGEKAKDPLVEIKGIGCASEPLESLSAISADATCLQQSMSDALSAAGMDKVDALVMHAPGTLKGDLAEKAAVDQVFGANLPLLTSNKWQVGHTFAASGPLSLEMAILMIQNNHFQENPFYPNRRHLPSSIETVMVNAVGFGGNAVSIIIAKI